MNQYRCETCNNCNKKRVHMRYDKYDTYEFYCNKFTLWIFGTAYNTIEIIGCSSHSDFQDQYVNVKVDQSVKTVGDRIWFVRVKDGDTIKIYPENQISVVFKNILEKLRHNITNKKVYHVYDDHLKGLTFYVKLDDIYKEIDKIVERDEMNE